MGRNAQVRAKQTKFGHFRPSPSTQLCHLSAFHRGRSSKLAGHSRKDQTLEAPGFHGFGGTQLPSGIPQLGQSVPGEWFAAFAEGFSRTLGRSQNRTGLMFLSQAMRGV